MGDEGRNSRIADVPATQADPIYGIGDVVALTGISAFTIRYYDKCGFFPNLHRDKRGVRTFSEADVAQLHLVEALRKSGLSIEGIQYFVRLCRRGDHPGRAPVDLAGARDRARVPARGTRREPETAPCRYGGFGGRGTLPRTRHAIVRGRSARKRPVSMT